MPDRLEAYRLELHKPPDCPYCWMLEVSAGRFIRFQAWSMPSVAPICGAEYELDR